MFEKPDHVTSPFWFCVDCLELVPGATHQEASSHLFERSKPEQWGHWIWEFAWTDGNRFPYESTGREIHTSDGGGYYVSLPTDHGKNYVYEQVSRKIINNLFRTESPATEESQYFLNGLVAHTVNPSFGDQGRKGQVVAYCGFGRVQPRFVTDLLPYLRCKVCARNKKTADANA